MLARIEIQRNGMRGFMLLAEGDLLLGLHVFEEGDDFFTLESLEKTRRHHGEVGDGAGLDVAFWDGGFLADHVEDDFLVVFFADVTRKGLAILGDDGDHLIGVGDVGAGVENVKEEVIEIGTI